MNTKLEQILTQEHRVITSFFNYIKRGLAGGAYEDFDFITILNEKLNFFKTFDQRESYDQNDWIGAYNVLAQAIALCQKKGLYTLQESHALYNGILAVKDLNKKKDEIQENIKDKPSTSTTKPTQKKTTPKNPKEEIDDEKSRIEEI